MARILIVDDDDLWSLTLARRLAREGHEADFVLTAEEALNRIHSATEPFEILLIDHRLGPGMDGIELLRQARAVSLNSDAVLFTGLDEPGVGMLAYQAGAYRYLHKPFESQELILIIQSLLDWRKTDYERNWLSILNAVVEELQRANTVAEVGRALVDGGIRLGFDRARFYQVRDVDGTPSLIGICQGGVNQVVGFETIVRSMQQTKYSKVAYEQRAPIFFHSRELGTSFLSEYPTQDGSPDSFGEWASIPLSSGESCIGILNLDNAARKGTIHPQQKDLLRLFAGQAVSALERALRYEQDRQERQIENLARKIIHQMGNPAEKDALDRLLSAIRENFLGREQDDNFIVALQDKETGWYRYRLHIENGVPFPSSWRAPTQGGLIEYVMVEKSPLFLASNTAAFRKDRGIAQVGLNPAHSWMGVPLRIGEDVIGAVVMENDYRNYAFTEDQFNSFKHLAGHLTSVIQAAWLNEQEREYSQLLHQLQEASELIPGFNEEKLWWTTLTLCTADYGASFDRAMLFLAEEDKTRLRGRMAVGHLKKEDAEADWEEYVRIGMNWEKFLTTLKSDELKPTPLDDAVRDWAFAVSQGDAFSEVLSNNKFLSVSKENAQNRLPADFLARFGATHYCLVPVNAGEQMVGVVVLDNIWEKDPNRLGVLEILDNLTNQAALLAENLHKSKALEDLIALQHDVLVQSTVRSLQETLQRICEAAKSIAGADLAAIYPLQDNGEELRYDHRYSARVGRRNLPDSALSHTPTGLSRYALLEAKEPVLIEDVMADETFYGGERHGDTAIVKDEGIRATIAVPVFGRRTGAARAMFYIDYHTPRAFSEHDRRIAEAFAHLIATAIRNWRDAQGLRDVREAQDKELSRLSEVLQSALAAESDERQIAQLLLEKIPALFEPLPVTTGITLREWQRSTADDEPTEIYRFIYPVKNGLKDRLIQADEKSGVNGRAVRTGILQNVADVSKDNDYQPRYQGYEDTKSELDVPIWVDGQVVGALNIESSQLAVFTKHHEEMGQRFADIAALAIGNVRRQRNLRTVFSAASALTGPTRFRDTLDTIASTVRDAIPNLSLLVIWYLDPESRRPRLGSYFGVSKTAIQRESPRKEGAVQKGLTLIKPYYQPDVVNDILFQGRSFVNDEGIVSTAIFPLRVQDKAVGVMFFSYRVRHEFTDEERRLFPILAEVVASSINDALQLYHTEREHKRLRATQEVTDVISSSVTAEQVITGVKQVLGKLYPRCAIYLTHYNERTGSFDLPSEVGSHAIHANGKPDCFLCQLAQKSQRTGKKQVRIRRHRSLKGASRPLQPGTRVSLGATLVDPGNNGNGRLLGVLLLESPQEDAFDNDDKATIRNVARLVRLALLRVEQAATDRFQSTVIGVTASATPIIHHINRYTGRILHRVDLLREEKSLTEDGRNAVIEIYDETQKMQQRVAAIDLRSEEEAVIEIDTVLPDWVQSTLAERSVPIDLDLNLNAGVSVLALPKTLHQVVYDLVRNGMEAMGLKRPDQKIVIHTRISPDAHYVDISIWNSGPAIPISVQPKLFNALYSSKGQERGIGLLFARAAMDRMKGEVWLDSSSEDEGTRFVVRLRISGEHIQKVRGEEYDDK